MGLGADLHAKTKGGRQTSRVLQLLSRNVDTPLLDPAEVFDETIEKTRTIEIIRTTEQNLCFRFINGR